MSPTNIYTYANKTQHILKFNNTSGKLKVKTFSTFCDSKIHWETWEKKNHVYLVFVSQGSNIGFGTDTLVDLNGNGKSGLAWYLQRDQWGPVSSRPAPEPVLFPSRLPGLPAAHFPRSSPPRDGAPSQGRRSPSTRLPGQASPALGLPSLPHIWASRFS